MHREPDYEPTSIFDVPLTDVRGKKYKSLRDLVPEPVNAYLIVNVASNHKDSETNFEQLVRMDR